MKMNNEGDMNIILRRVATVMGLILLGISIYWSQDGFNFNIAGDSAGTDIAVLIGYTIAIAVTVVQFVFSTNLKELNASLIVFGVIAYAYSIYTNYQGIIHFQGKETNEIMAAVLGFAMDGVPEPLIAWGLRESLTGDFVGNILKGVGLFVAGKPLSGQNKGGGQNNNHNNHQGGKNKNKGFDRRKELESMYRANQGGMYHGQNRRQGGGEFARMEQIKRHELEEEE